MHVVYGGGVGKKSLELDYRIVVLFIIEAVMVDFVSHAATLRRVFMIANYMNNR